jgi:putative endonuclease
MWYLYIILTENNKLYTGITTNLERRYHEHCFESKGAKFTRANPPKELVHVELFDDRSQASKRECEIKKLSRKQKNELCRTN